MKRTVKISLWLLIGSMAIGIIWAKPNIVLMMSDDQGYAGLSSFGTPRIQTPNFDKIAEDGIRLTNFYAGHANCSPTRISFLTGRHPHRSNSTHAGWPIRSQEVTLPEILKENGYRNAHFGKWHIGELHPNKPTAPRNNGYHYWYAAPNFYVSDPIFLNDTGFVYHTGEGSRVTAQRAIEFIAQAAKDKQPFFTTVWFGSPHSPWTSWEQKDKDAVNGGPNENAINYHAEIVAMDAAVGMILNSLDSHNIAENTIVWFNSDNGPERRDDGQADPLRGQKNQLWEGGVRVPAVIRWPAGIPKNQVNDFTSSTNDILPTIMEIVGIPMGPNPPPLDGISILPMLQAKPQTRDKTLKFWMASSARVIATWPFEWRQHTDAMKNDIRAAIKEVADKEAAGQEVIIPDSPINQNVSGVNFQSVVAGDFKLMCTNATNCMLYNLALDTAETNNIASSNTALFDSLKAELETWKTGVLASTNGDDYNNRQGCKDTLYKEYDPFALSEDVNACKELIITSVGRLFGHSKISINSTGLNELWIHSQMNVRVQLKLFDIHGKILKSIDFSLIKGKNMVPITLPKKGLYLLKMIGSDGVSQTEKIMI